MKNYRGHRLLGSKMGRPTNLERIRELEEAERTCKAANESQRKTIRALEAELAAAKARNDESFSARQMQARAEKAEAEVERLIEHHCEEHGLCELFEFSSSGGGRERDTSGEASPTRVASPPPFICPACGHQLVRKGDEMVHARCRCDCDGTEKWAAANPIARLDTPRTAARKEAKA